MDLISVLNILDYSTLLPLVDIETLIKLYLNSNVFRRLLEKAVSVLCIYHQLPTSSNFKEFISNYDYLKLSERTFSYIGLGQALIRACKEGHLPIVSDLLSRGAPKSYKTVSVACERGYTNIVKLLLTGEKDEWDDNLWDASHIAFEKGHIDIIEFIIANRNLDNLHGAMVSAVRGGDLLLMKRLMDGGKFNISMNRSVITAAFSSGNQHIIQYILSKVDAWVNVHRCTLEGLIEGGHVQHFTDVFNRDSSDAKHWLRKASMYGNTDIVKVILSKHQPENTDVNYIMMNAASLDNTHLVHMMLDRGGNNFDDCASYAAYSGHLDIVQLMIDRGATNYEVIMRQASWNGHTDIVRAMLERGTGNYNQCLSHACEGGYLDIIQLMLDKGAVVSSNDIEDATNHGHIDILAVLESEIL